MTHNDLYCFLDESLADDGSFYNARLIPLNDFKQNKNIYECDAIICGDNSDGVSSSVKYCGTFFRLPQNVRALWLEECVNKEGNLLIDCEKLFLRYLELSQRISEMLKEEQQQCKVFISFTKDDLCVALPFEFVGDNFQDFFSELRNHIADYINGMVPKEYSSYSTSDEDVASVIEEINARLEKMYFFKRNLYNDSYRSALKQLVNI